MSKLKSFLKGNVKQAVNEPLTLDRFDEDLIIKLVPSKEGEAINDRCFVNKVGMKGKQERVFDPVKYNREMNIASIVHPDLHNAELQESYGVKGAEALYHEMFYHNETLLITQKVSELGGENKDINDDIAEAKN